MTIFDQKKIKELREVFPISKRMLLLLWEIDRFLFIGMLVIMAIPTVIPFINAYIYALIIDLIVSSFTTQFDYSALFILLGLRFLTLLVQNVAFSAQGYMDLVLWTKTPIFLYQKILSKISSLDIEYLENSEFKDTLQKVKESYVYMPMNFYSNLFFTYQSLLQLLIALIALSTLNWIFSVVIIIGAIPALINQVYFSRTLWGLWSEHSPFRKRFWYLSELIQDRQGAKELKIFSMAGTFLSQIETMQKKFAKENLSVGRKRLTASIGLNILSSTVFVGIEAFIALLAISRQISLGSLSYFSFVIWNFQGGVNGLFSNLGRVFDNSLYIKDIIRLLDMPPLILTSKNPVIISSKTPPKIEFRNVWFTYPGTKKHILKDLSLIVNPGEKIAFVGENGAGKTTIIKLLARFYDVSKGEILINNINIKNLDLVSWHKSLGIIFQDFIKYEYSLAENIHFGKAYEEFNLEKIKKSATLSGADKIAQNLPQEYSQMLGSTFDNGIDLSLGQWQKIALSRAFFRDAPILVLDEPTSSIDAKSEQEIFDKVDKLSQDKTVITISHRFSTVKNADTIYVLNRGRIIEKGNHKQLLKQGGTYEKLFNLQAQRYK